VQPQRDPIDRAALEYLGNILVLPFDPDARQVAFDFLHQRQHPGAIEERSVGTPAFDFALAQRNAVEVLRRAEQIARGRGLEAVDSQSVRLAIKGLCPGFFPFC
jgi:hypothetical protein